MPLNFTKCHSYPSFQNDGVLEGLEDSSSESSSGSGEEGSEPGEKEDAGVGSGESDDEEEKDEAGGLGDDESGSGDDDGRGASQPPNALVPSPDKTKCIEEVDHDIANLNMNDQESYLREGQRLFEMECAECELELTLNQEEAKGGEKTLFDRSHPVYCCSHQQKRMCDYLLCNSCYMKKLPEGRPRRNRPATPAIG